MLLAAWRCLSGGSGRRLLRGRARSPGAPRCPRGRAAGTVEIAGVIRRRIGCGGRLDRDRVPPVVAEVIGVGELGNAAVDEGAELRGFGGIGRVAQAVPLRIGDGKALPAGAELVQVTVLERLTAWMTSCNDLSEAVSGTSTRRQLVGCQSSSAIFRQAIRSTWLVPRASRILARRASSRAYDAIARGCKGHRSSNRMASGESGVVQNISCSDLRNDR